MFDGKYEKELPVRINVIGSFIPIWEIIVLLKLGWRYGLLSLLTHILIFFGSLLLLVGLVGMPYGPSPDREHYGAYLFLVTYFVLNGFTTWHFLKKHNARVRVNKEAKKAAEEIKNKESKEIKNKLEQLEKQIKDLTAENKLEQLEKQINEIYKAKNKHDDDV